MLWLLYIFLYLLVGTGSYILYVIFHSDSKRTKKGILPGFIIGWPFAVFGLTIEWAAQKIIAWGDDGSKFDKFLDRLIKKGEKTDEKS